MLRWLQPTAQEARLGTLLAVLDDLLATEGVREETRLEGRIGFMALHAGLETATYEIASEAAQAAGASFYAVRQPWSLYWHVPSIQFDPVHSGALTGFLEHVGAVISVHGFGRPGLESALLLGGRHRALARRVGRALSAEGYHVVDDLEQIPSSLRGLHPRNPVNLPEHGGVQIEIGPQHRRRDVAPRPMVSALAGVARAEMAGLCARPDCA